MLRQIEVLNKGLAPFKKKRKKNKRVKYAGVCSVKCGVNNKELIFATTDIARKLKDVRARLNKGIHTNKELQADYNLYGAKRFKIKKVEHQTVKGEGKVLKAWKLVEARRSAKDYIKRRKTEKPNGYNEKVAFPQ